MAIFRNRFASIQDIVLVFAACAFPVYSWSILRSLEKLPAWLFYLNVWDVISIFAYAQIFALLEIAMVLFALILLGAILPARFFRDRFVAQGSAVVFLNSGWAIAIQHNSRIILSWTPRSLLLWLALYLASMGALYALLHRYKRLEEAIYSFAERLTVLLYVYVPTAFLSVIIVILRNIGVFE